MWKSLNAGVLLRRQRDCIWQPTLTGHIQALEEELGTVLLNPMGGNVLQTEAGQILFDYGKHSQPAGADISFFKRLSGAASWRIGHRSQYRCPKPPFT